MDPATFETYLATPHGTDFVPVATALGLVAHDITDAAELAQLISTPADAPRLIQVRTDREENLQLHQRITAAVRESLAYPD
jgi:2-succinyl-5-enolpyruvyl-6-hydroxy-3-cyclohexene-1-carboxylate synthase